MPYGVDDAYLARERFLLGGRRYRNAMRGDEPHTGAEQGDERQEEERLLLASGGHATSSGDSTFGAQAFVREEARISAR